MYRSFSFSVITSEMHVSVRTISQPDVKRLYLLHADTLKKELHYRNWRDSYLFL